MLLRVNKKISSGKAVKYATLSNGTISHVWYDENSSSASVPKRKNRIRMTRDTSQEHMDHFDA